MKLPPLPDNVPAIVGKSWLRFLSKKASENSGWQVEALPNVPKAVVIAAPHSSNWDGLIGVVAAFGIGLRINWMGKHQLFRWPLAAIMRAFGGISTVRDSAHGVVDQFAEKMRDADKMWLVVAPEGTRKQAETWRLICKNFMIFIGRFAVKTAKSVCLPRSWRASRKRSFAVH